MQIYLKIKGINNLHSQVLYKHETRFGCQWLSTRQDAKGVKVVFA